MAEELTKLQEISIADNVKKLYKTEKIVNYDLDFSKWKIKALYKDTLYVKLLDEPVADAYKRNGIVLPFSQTRGAYRIAEVVMAGPDVKTAKVGDYIRFQTGVGQPYEVPIDGYKTWLLREDSVMAVVEFDGDKKDIEQDLIDKVLTQ